MSVSARLCRLEGRFGADDTERWLRSLTDEQLDADLDGLLSAAKLLLSDRGIECSDMATGEVIARLEEVERSEINQERSCAAP
jgi:hypothetical protein